MATQIFLNLPVKDLLKTREFFAKLGYTFNEQFSNESGACMVISETIYVMLLTEPFFKSFTSKQIADTSKTTEVMIALSAESKESVNDLVEKAFKAGATQHNEVQDHGFMYSKSFQDLDGHIWEVFWMNPNHVQ